MVWHWPDPYIHIFILFFKVLKFFISLSDFKIFIGLLGFKIFICFSLFFFLIHIDHFPEDVVGPNKN